MDDFEYNFYTEVYKLSERAIGSSNYNNPPSSGKLLSKDHRAVLFGSIELGLREVSSRSTLKRVYNGGGDGKGVKPPKNNLCSMNLSSHT